VFRYFSEIKHAFVVVIEGACKQLLLFTVLLAMRSAQTLYWELEGGDKKSLGIALVAFDLTGLVLKELSTLVHLIDLFKKIPVGS
jgi:hypothetical protein